MTLAYKYLHRKVLLLAVGGLLNESLAFVSISRRGLGFVQTKISVKETPVSADAHLESSPIVRELIQGDFAGLQANFDMQGKRIPIPINLIPASLIEWGQEPTSLETFVSENNLTRQTLTILPETGCAVDNLETRKSSEVYDSQVTNEHGANMMRSVIKTISDEIVYWESTFEWIPLHRVRMGVSIVADKDVLKLVPPVTISLERQFSPISSHGTLADGGGLHGSRVSECLGPVLRKMADFATEEIKQNDDLDSSLLLVKYPGNLTLSSHYDGPVFHATMTHFNGPSQTTSRCSIRFTDLSSCTVQFD